MRRFRFPHISPRHAGALAALAVLTSILSGVAGSSPAVGSDPGTLESRIARSYAREGELHSGIRSDTHAIEGFQGSIDDLQARLSALQASLQVERNVLVNLKSQLRAARSHLASLQVQLVRDKQVLVAQVIASYESPPPNIATVVLEAHGFADLIERVDDLRAIARENARATVRVNSARVAVGAQTRQLTDLEARQERETTAVLVQRDEVAQLHIALLDRQLRFVHARDRKSAELGSLRSHRQALEQELSKIQARELAAQTEAFANVGGIGGAPSGEDGFFPAAGTNYSVGVEPELATHLNALGKALHLHLIGISGYRSPQHSLEVGGFADDPHTRGEASDTPGVEGVPEGTLEQFGLTRPFSGAAEADHIQLLGSAR
jgi:peptidoglycan hydrolase CwlO-like protein